MFEGNSLTFNPRWDSDAKELPDYTDVGDIQARLKDLGVTLAEAADPATTGPASVSLVDPDASVILIDQHVSPWARVWSPRTRNPQHEDFVGLARTAREAPRRRRSRGRGRHPPPRRSWPQAQDLRGNDRGDRAWHVAHRARLRLSVIAATSGAGAIGDLRVAAGVSSTHLAQRFKELIGVTPKRLARTYRFAATGFAMNPAGPIDWGDVAYGAGYFDQAHFGHEFRAFTGLTPTRYVEVRRRFLREHPGHALDSRPVPTD